MTRYLFFSRPRGQKCWTQNSDAGTVSKWGFPCKETAEAFKKFQDEAYIGWETCVVPVELPE